MTSGVKVYYLPLKASIDNLVIFPSFIGTMPLLRYIYEKLKKNFNTRKYQYSSLSLIDECVGHRIYIIK
jgi:hypothetical protein